MARYYRSHRHYSRRRSAAARVGRTVVRGTQTAYYTARKAYRVAKTGYRIAKLPYQVGREICRAIIKR